MKKVGIVTICDNDNYGNRLQNYALQETIKKIGHNVITLKNDSSMNTNSKILLRKINFLRISIKRYIKSDKDRKMCYNRFNKNIKFSKYYINPKTHISNKFDYFVCGSDQIWKPTYGRMRDVDLLTFAKDDQKISYAASFGIDNIDKKYYDYMNSNLRTFKAISVREYAGKKIVEDITGRKDVEVLLDPTFLLNAEEWKKVEKKPTNFDVPKSYILCYFLGNLSNKRLKVINDYANEKGLEIINILDKKSKYYKSGPAEFLYLERNATMILTDSFHACVFAIINHKPFMIFDREDNKVNMNSRIETLCNMFSLQNKFVDSINKVSINYIKINKIIEREKKKSIDFLTKSFI